MVALCLHPNFSDELAASRCAIVAMGKSKEKRSAKTESPKKSKKADKSFIKVDKKAFDPTLASLFASSAGPVQAPAKSRYRERAQKQTEKISHEQEANDAELSSASESLPSDDDEHGDQDSDDEDMSDASESESENEAVLAKLRESALKGAQEKPKKRKRGDKEDIEDAYLRKLAREEEKEEEQRQKKRKTKEDDEDEDESSEEAGDDDDDETEDNFTVPKHESLVGATDGNATEVEKAARTVFLGNVSIECINSKPAEKALKKHLESFIPDLADNTPLHKIESIRFRSTAFGSSLPKRAAFAKKDIMDATTKSTNAYAVYTTKVAAREAVKRLNGSVFLNRHLHVDSVAHPTKVDHRRCVFVGNLPFVDDESQTPDAEGEKPKSKKPASDIEEGLWVQFAKCGKVESVRVVRDAKTRVGKGFAYVQFVDENGVEAALQLNEQKFPPMLPRKLRITRCKAEKKKDKPRGPPPSSKSQRANGKAGYAPKLTEEQKSLQGRARSMLGKVAKAQTKEGFVFEGHRASERQGKSGLKFKGSGGKKKGPNGRKSRSAGWKKSGGKK
ncbi:nucleolar 12 [Pyrenophora seminiperda CCB06]|uniref:Nucleolar protein 12 n=1 Tax=Pyrenophora seminiperda CCB06 TaxID=1302712 RepID=A0A3M7LXM3_9PLEO|nr:nucleolar 12 [Pyrenophora seminiperda CCB06]